MKWYWFQLVALIRGLFYKWPKAPWIPKGYTGVHCALRSWRESRDMWAMGWVPYVVHRTTDGSIARMFIIVDDQPHPEPPDFGPDDQRGEEEFEEMEEQRHEQPVLGCDCFDCIR